MKKDLRAFQRFGVGKKIETDSNNNRAILYTRVSTTHQEDNTSLEHQYRTCLRFADREGLEVVAEFGGKGESAKEGSARKEYERMVKFAQKKSNRIRYIVFYDYSRFSREGGKAIVTKDRLRQMGIFIKSATMPIDTSNPFGSAMEDIQFLYAKMENDVRRKRCVDGTVNKLREGKWCGTAPVGYKWDNGEMVQDPKTAPLVRKAFEWKLTDPMITAEEIRRRLRRKGLSLTKERMSRLLRNPIYCGLIANKLLEGEVVQGNHKPIISKKLFLAVHGIVESRNASGWQHAQETEELPLKVFTKCECCGKPLTGYLVKKKGGVERPRPIPYYKCRKKGCKVNVSANKLGEIFVSELRRYQLKPELRPLIRKELMHALSIRREEQTSEQTRLKAQLRELDKKLRRLKERYVLDEEITRADYEEFSRSLKKKQADLQEEIAQCKNGSSNPEKAIEHSLQIASNLAAMWENGDFRTRQKVQSIAFPQGIFFDKENGTVRTPRVNALLRLSSHYAHISPPKNTKTAPSNRERFGWVGPTGLEPVTT